MGSIFSDEQHLTEAPKKQSVQYFSNIVIPQRFRRKIIDHQTLFSCRIVNRAVRSPQLLFLVGPPGCGKTRMAEATLKEFGITPVILPASTLGGELEGDSVKPLVLAYLEAQGSGEHCGALIIDDFDLSAGRIDENQTSTINGSLLNSFLMSRADNPFQIESGDKPFKTYAVDNPPIIIITANDTGKIYGPLKRPGRALIFEWKPNGPDLIEMVSGLYPGLKKAEAIKLVNTFPNQPIAFFEQLGYCLSRKIVGQYMESHNISHKDHFDISATADMIDRSSGTGTFAQLMRAGREMLSAHVSQSYLTNHEDIY